MPDTMEDRFRKSFCSFNLSADERCKECIHKTFDGSSIAENYGSAEEYILTFIRKEKELSFKEGRASMAEEVEKDVRDMKDELGEPNKINQGERFAYSNVLYFIGKRNFTEELKDELGDEILDLTETYQ
jgi:hypothetical protein